MTFHLRDPHRDLAHAASLFLCLRIRAQHKLPTLDQTLHRLCIITSDVAVKLLLVFYALYELTFVALVHSSEVFVLPRLSVGHAVLSTGHAES